MKALVETIGDIMLMDVMSGAIIPENRPAVVLHGSFVQHQISLNQLRIIATDLSDEATDEEWAKWFAESKGDTALAVDSFLSKFGPNAKPVVKSKTAPSKSD